MIKSLEINYQVLSLNTLGVFLLESGQLRVLHAPFKFESYDFTTGISTFPKKQIKNLFFIF